MTGAKFAPRPPKNLSEHKQWKAGEFWGRTSSEDYIDLREWVK